MPAIGFLLLPVVIYGPWIFAAYLAWRFVRAFERRNSVRQELQDVNERLSAIEHGMSEIAAKPNRIDPI